MNYENCQAIPYDETLPSPEQPADLELRNDLVERHKFALSQAEYYSMKCEQWQRVADATDAGLRVLDAANQSCGERVGY